MVTQMLRQRDAEVFKLVHPAKLGMMREALAKLDRKANERLGNFFTEKARCTDFHSHFPALGHNREEAGRKED